MEKIKLSNGTEIEILSGATVNSFSVEYVTLEDVEKVIGQLTEENLVEIRVLNEKGAVCTIQHNKDLSEVHLDVKGKIATFTLSNVDMIAKRLAELEVTQELQDGAIMELAELSGGM